MREWFDDKTQSIQKRDVDSEKGGTMRLGAYPCRVAKETFAHAAYRSKQDDRCLPRRIGVMNLLCQFATVDLRHVHVQYGHVERLSRPHPSLRLGRRRCSPRAQPPCLAESHKDLHVRLIVIHDQYALVPC